jgi:hypothetical protein
MAGSGKVVPLAGIEPALLAETDFESVASTSSATGARAMDLEPEGRGQVKRKSNASRAQVR